MFINKEKKKRKILAAIANAKDHSYYRILPTGQLAINKKFVSHVFLTYDRGNWFASHGTRKGSSVAIPEAGIPLCAYGNDCIWITNDNGEADISTSVIPLEEDTHFVMFAFSGKEYDVIIADGTKYSTAIAFRIKKTEEAPKFLIMALTALIREYDAKAAEDILKFWFREFDSDDPEADHAHPIIDLENNNEKEDAG